VPKGQARLRVSVTALHTFEQIDALADALGTLL
jgi:7-keto-8-aminopelargonate synthetase-like enzyme